MKYSSYSPLLTLALEKLDSWRESFGESQTTPPHSYTEFEIILQKLVSRLQGNYPFHHSSYAGQMLKPPHPLAWMAYSLASTINPNNHALDGGPPTSEMEKEIVAKMAKMVGFSDSFLGHLTSSGTTANLEALWVVSKQLKAGKKIAFSDHAHYTHERLTSVLNIPSLKIPTKPNGDWDWSFVEKNLHDIGAFVVTLGTTGRGIIEPLTKVLELKLVNPECLIHVDAAYGGFFGLIAESIAKPDEFRAIQYADSIVIDPHKHGLQPYGCGSILFKNPQVGKLYKHDSPYTYFSSDELHLGEISLECSRAGAAAAALWATLEYFPLSKEGLGSVLMQCREAALDFSQRLEKSAHFSLLETPQLDIVIYFPNKKMKASSVSHLSKTIFSYGMNLPAEKGFHLSLFTLSSEVMKFYYPEFEADTDSVTVLRSVFMKPEHKQFTEELMRRLEIAIKNISELD